MDKWKLCSQEKPPLKKLVFVFRSQKRRYVAVHLEHFIADDECDRDSIDWVSQHGTCYPMQDDDLWMEFQYVKTEHVHDR